MSEQSKTRELPDPDIFGPPFFGVGLGEKLGALDARLVHVEKDVAELKNDVKNLTSKVDELAHTIQHKFTAVDEKFASLEKRLDSNTKMLWGMFTAMLAAIIIQKFI